MGHTVIGFNIMLQKKNKEDSWCYTINTVLPIQIQSDRMTLYRCSVQHVGDS